MNIVNPILRGFNPDPSICRVGDDYFIATSTFEWFPGVQIHHSRDLANWELVSRPLTRAAQLDMRGNPDSCGVWAPALSHADGIFWLTYTNVRRYDGNYKDTPNFLVTAPAIDGPWSDPVFLNASGFDPSLFHDDDGRKYLVNMVWDYRATMDGRHEVLDLFGGIVLQEYDPAAKALTGPRKMIFHRSDLGYTEAPHLMKRRGWYYLITAEGGTGYNHAVTHARSQDIAGPYELHPNTHVLTAKDRPDAPLQRVGHGQPCDGPGDTVLHTFLCSRPLPGQRSPMGRESGIDVLEWGEDDWLYRSDRQPVPSVGASARTTPAEEETRFTPGPLPPSFQWLRSPEPDRLFSLSDRAGWLRLFGRESVGSWFEQALVARRQTEQVCSAETELDFAPESFQQMAGLIAYYNRHQFHYAYLSADDDGVRRLAIQSCPGSWPEGKLVFPLGEGVEVGPGPLRLGLDIDNGRLQFRYAQAGGWQPLGPELDASILADEAGRGMHANFTGTFLGMTAQDLTGQGNRRISGSSSIAKRLKVRAGERGDMADLQLRNLTKRFGSAEVIPELSLDIPHGSFTVLVGPSGCGKSTLLRMIAGLEEVTSGSIRIGDTDVTHLDPSQRGIAMVFQSYALYPHMTVAENIGFALKLARAPKEEITRRVGEAAEILQLSALLDRKPKALSGGQRQRVAIGRAIVRQPKVFLFDEPLSNLDAALRGQMRVELAELHAELGATMVYVTHDQVEAMTMADQIVVMKEGRIQQVGAPLELYAKPQNTFVAGFIGAPKMNLIRGPLAQAHGGEAIGIRPEHLTLVDGEGMLAGKVVLAEHLGADTLAHVETEATGRIVLRLDGETSVMPGQHVALAPKPGRLQVFDGDGRTRAHV